jgi:hypothetical protein
MDTLLTEIMIGLPAPAQPKLALSGSGERRLVRKKGLEPS